jgi:hypothetical protein
LELIIHPSLPIGGEITSPALIDSSKTWLDIEMICQMLKSKRIYAGDITGGHIHFGTQIMNGDANNIIKLIKLWVVYEKVIHRFSNGEKETMRDGVLEHAKPLTLVYNKLISIAQEINDFKYKQRVVGGYIFGYNRSLALNFLNMTGKKYEKRNTIEVRYPNGTLNSIIWQNNVNFFAKLILYARSKKYDEDFINKKIDEIISRNYDEELYNQIYLAEALELCDMIFDNNLDKMYFLRQYLKILPNNEEELNNKGLIIR